MALIRVGIIRGGPSNESFISLKSGENILSNLPEEYIGHDIVLSKDLEWYFDKKPFYFEKISRSIDVVFNTLRGYYGEDGKIQQMMEMFNIPFTGSGSISSSIAANKLLTYRLLSKEGFKVPPHYAMLKCGYPEKKAMEIFKKIGPSLAVKPNNSGSSIGVNIVHNFNDLLSAIKIAFAYSPVILVEKYIKGREVTCGIIDDFRGEQYYSLPIAEIIPHKEKGFFDYESKFKGSAKEMLPANFSIQTKKEVEDLARKIHKLLGCRHYSKSDFIITPKDIYILEINTLPSLAKESVFSRAINAIGLSHKEFIKHILTNI